MVCDDQLTAQVYKQNYL